MTTKSAWRPSSSAFGFDLATPALSAYEALEIATLNGGKATGFADEVGALVPGMKGAMRSSSISTGGVPSARASGRTS